MKNRRKFLLTLILTGLLLVGGTLLFTASASDKPKPDVSRIHGKIQYVTSFPDYKVEIVTAFEDLDVEEVNAFPEKPGQWQIVDAFPDYKIQKVNEFGDFKIKYVSAFPGSTHPDHPR